MLNLYLYLKYNFLKYKYYFIFGVILILGIVYFLFFREIRNIEISGNNFYENNDINVEYNLRSKSKIQSINIEANYDFDILNEFKYKDEYLDFLKDNGVYFSIPCDGNKCDGTINMPKLYESFLDYVKTYKKDDIYAQLEMERLNDLAMEAVAADNSEEEAENSDEILEENFDGENFSGELNYEELGVLNFEENPTISYDTELEENYDEPTEVDCEDERFKFDLNCYKTPDIDFDFKGLKIKYEIIFKNGEKEVNEISFDKAKQILIKGDNNE